jgi:glycosyltransferase involved in cell wall biosynthesis
MSGEPHVSVCIRAHTRADGLRSAIGSVLGQTYGDFEVVVSDDSGRLESVAAGFGDPRVRYHRNARPAGPAANLVNSVSLARGRLVAILNDDDYWLPGFLAATVDVLDRHPDVGIVFSDDFLEIRERRVRRRLPFAPGRHQPFLRQLLEHSMPPSAAVMRRAVWDDGERAIPVSPRMVADAVVWLRSASAGWPFYYIDEPLAVSRVHSRQISWSDEGLPTLLIAAYNAFRFEDPICEDLRRARVAEFLLARANVHLVRNRFGDACADIARAHRTAPRPMGLRAALALSGSRGLAIRWGCSRPSALVAVLELWRRFRPAVLPRRILRDRVALARAVRFSRVGRELRGRSPRWPRCSLSSAPTGCRPRG